MRTWHDVFIRRGIKMLIVASPFLFAGVPGWANSLLRVAVFSVFLVWLLKIARQGEITVRPALPLAFLSVFVILTVFQLLPLPPGMLRLLSPRSADIYMTATGTAGPWYPITLHPQATLTELLNLCACCAIYLVVASEFRSRQRVLGLVRLIVFTGIALILFAIIQKAAWNGRIYWFYPIDDIYSGRLGYIWGPYLNRNHFSAYLEMASPLALGYMLYLLTRSSNVGGKRMGKVAAFLAHNKMSEVTLYFLCFVVMAGTIFATLSRGGIMAFGASMAVLLALTRMRRSIRGRTVLIAATLLVIAAVGLFAAWERIEERFYQLSDNDRLARSKVWTDLVPLVEDYPLFGSGLGAFERSFQRYQTGYSTVRFEHAENDYLELLADAGGIGFALALAALATYFRGILREWRDRKRSLSICIGAGCIASIFAFLVHSMTDFNLRIPANAMLFATIAGLAAAAVNSNREESVPEA